MGLNFLATVLATTDVLRPVVGALVHKFRPGHYQLGASPWLEAEVAMTSMIPSPLLPVFRKFLHLVVL